MKSGATSGIEQTKEFVSNDAGEGSSKGGFHDDHHMEDGWQSEELLSMSSGDDEEYEAETVIPETKGYYAQFYPEDMSKDFQFHVGMEFTSIKQFKDAIKEFSVLNGREIRFLKNDKTRCKVICKGKCSYRMLCSKVGGKETFSIKKMKDKYTCGRIFHNKNASSKWVAKQMVEKMRIRKKFTITEIVDEVRVEYQTGITRYKAWRARKRATDVVEGDACQQYNLLWRFSAELRRANRGNTCKLMVVRPPPTLEPRFWRFYMCLDGCKKGFINGCRPFIGLDRCHLKTQFGGILLCALGRDPNDQYYPLEFVVVEFECTDSWGGFF